MRVKKIKRKVASKNYLFPILIIGGVFILLVFSSYVSQAASFIWNQVSWGGEATSTVAVYPANQNDWAHYSQAVNAATSSLIATSGLVSLWRFNGNANDSVGANNGAASGSPSYVSGISNQAISLDGNNDFMEVPDNDSLDLENNFTISAWVKKSESGRYQTILDKGYYKLGIDSNNQAYFQIISNDQPAPYTYTGDAISGARLPAAAIYDGKYYLSGWHGQVSRYDGGTTWTYVGTPVGGSPADYGFNNSFLVHNEQLYSFAYLNGDNGNIWRYNGGTSWIKVRTSGTDVYSSIVYEGKMYMISGDKAYRYDGGTVWTQVSAGTEQGLRYFVVYKGKLYCGADNYVYRYDGNSTWTIVTSGFGNYRVAKMAVFQDNIYFQLDGGSGDIYSFDGTTKTLVGNVVNGNEYLYGAAMTTYGGKLYSAVGEALYRYDGGTTWTNVASSTGDSSHSLSDYDGKLYVGKWRTTYSYGDGKSVYSGINIDDEYTQITANYNGSILKIYINGQLQATSSFSGSVATNTLPLLIGNSFGSTEGGGYNSTGEENFRGQIDEVRIYNRVLSAAEISGNYKAEKYGENNIFLTKTTGSVSQTTDADFSGTVSSTTVANNSIALEYIGQANTSAYNFPSSSTVIYRSTGFGNFSEIASDTVASKFININGSGGASFCTGLPKNIGVGDVLVYDSNSDNALTAADDVVFVHGRLSDTSLIVKNAAGANTATTTNTNYKWAIYRAYTSLANAEAGTKNASLSAIGIPYDLWTDGKNISSNATGTHEIWNIACYADGVDGPVVLSGWTTGDDNYLRIFTPYLPSDVGVSQRHNGKWDNSKYNSLTSANTAIMIYVGNVRIEGLQINHVNAQGWGDKAVWMSDTGTFNNNIYISSNIIKGDSSHYDWVNGIAIYADGGGRTFIYNNIIYNFTTSVLGGNIYFEGGGYVNYLYNNTTSNTRSCYTRISGTVYAFNNIAQLCTDGFNGTFAGTSNYNISDIAADAPNNGFGGGDATVSFISTATSTKDLRLKYDDTAARGRGGNYTADTNLPFSNDINAELRPVAGAWDIGADQYSGYAATGTYTSLPINIINTDFSAANWTSVIPASTTLAVKFRTATTSNMAAAVSWSDVYEYWNGDDFSNASGVTDGHSYLQYQLEFSIASSTATPTFSDITLNYDYYNATGNLISSAFDWGSDDSYLKSLGWTESLPATTNFLTSLRTASTSGDLASASWTQINRGDCNIAGGTAACASSSLPSAMKDGVNDRFGQYKFDFSGDGSATPQASQFFLTAETLPTYTVGGTISGLVGTLVLRNNGGDDLTTSANGAFVFATALNSGASYAVTVFSKPSAQTCTVSADSGTISGSVTNILVSCANNSSCGDGTCNGGETCSSCSTDCGVCQSGGGGGGGGLPPADTTPPGIPANFSALNVGRQNTLSWTNPLDSDFAGVKIYRKPNSAPAVLGDVLAALVYQGRAQNFVDTNLQSNQLYYYSIYSYDAKPNYSMPATIFVRVAAAGENSTTTILAAPSTTENPGANSGGAVTSLIGANSTLVNQVTRDEAAELLANARYVDFTLAEKTIYQKMIALATEPLSDQAKIVIAYFIKVGTPTTRVLGAGERGGTVASFRSAFGYLPETLADWQDTIKIGNGRWPTKQSLTAEAAVKIQFKKIYLRDPNMKQANDNAAVTVMAYGLRPAQRNTNSEKVAILSFKYIFKKNPASAKEWDVVRAIAYSGTKR